MENSKYTFRFIFAIHKIVQKNLILPCWECKMWTMGDGEREGRCEEDIQAVICVCVDISQLYILKTVSFYSV